jgi:plasmid stabilization system protein ParE
MRQNKPFRIVFSTRAQQDRTRLEQYLELLETRSKRLYALATDIKQLAKSWALNAFFDRKSELRVHYVGHWYSVFFPVYQHLETIIIVAILAQSEELKRLEG